MSIFGQVWLWSIAAFLIGVLLTWAVLVRPVQAKNNRLERELKAARAANRPDARPAPPAPAEVRPDEAYEPESRSILAQFDSDPEPDSGEPEPEPKRDAFASSFMRRPEPDSFASTLNPEPEPDAFASTYAPKPDVSRLERESDAFASSFMPKPEPGSFGIGHEGERGSQEKGADEQVDEPSRPAPDLKDDDSDGFWFEEERPEGEAKDGGDEADVASSPSQQPPPDHVGLRSVLEPEGRADAADEDVTTVIPKIQDEPVGDRGSERGSLFDSPEVPQPPEREPADEAPAAEAQPAAEAKTAPEAKPAEEVQPAAEANPAAEPKPPAYAFGGQDAPPADEANANETTQVLPRRQPSRGTSKAFEPLKPLQPSVRSVERPEPDQGGHSGSLFEPLVPVSASTATTDKAARKQAAQQPEPARQPASTAANGQGAGQSVPPGPFGPGSAMPLPGGRRPSDDFAVKASVTALRYCTEDSPQFNQMVAEVWFRTAEDAERVGFRPLT